MKATISNCALNERDLRHVEVELPDGWYRVLSGAIRPGDMHLNSVLFWCDGIVQWCDVDVTPKPFRLYSTADYFDCLIRRGEPCETVCPMCFRKPIPVGWRYCRECAWDIVQKQRT